MNKNERVLNKFKIIFPKNNTKGLTLIELLLSIAILSIVVMPYLASFLTSADNNIKSERVLAASNIAHKAMEELKAGSHLLREAPNWTVFVSGLGEIPWTSDPELANYTIEYRITETIRHHSVDNYIPPEGLDYEVYINVQSDTFSIETSNYPLSDSVGSIQHLLSLIASDALYGYSINAGASVSFVPDTGSIDIGIRFDSDEPGSDFMLEIAADGEITLPINIYILNDTMNKLMLSASGNNFNTYRSLNTDSIVPDFTSKLYNIDIRVKYNDGYILETISSMVKK